MDGIGDYQGAIDDLNELSERCEKYKIALERIAELDGSSSFSSEAQMAEVARDALDNEVR